DQPYAYLDLRTRTLAPLRFARFARLGDRLARRLGAVVEREFVDLGDTEMARKREAIGRYESQFRRLRPLLLKMLADFSRSHAREARRAGRHAEIVYRLAAAHS